MLYVYKRSGQPIHPWSIMRSGGVNNLTPDIKGKFLVLFNAQAVHLNGSWHYIFEFDVRDSLLLSPLAQGTMGTSVALQYRGDINWQNFLGDDWVIIDERIRDEILRPSTPGPCAQTAITDLREISLHHPPSSERQQAAPVGSPSSALRSSTDLWLGRSRSPKRPLPRPA